MEGGKLNIDGQDDEDAIYRQLGRYVIVFAALENQLFQLASFALDPDHAGHGRRATAELWFKQLVDTTSTAVKSFLEEHCGDELAFQAQLEALLRQCRDLAGYRNKVVHSAYVFLEGGDDNVVAIVRSDMTQGAGANEIELDQELLSEKSFEEAIGEIALVAFAIGQCRLQLIAWYRLDARNGG